MTHVVRLTPAGRGAVAVVLVDGPSAVEIVQSRFVSATGRSLDGAPVDRILFGRWRHGEVGAGNDDRPGEQVVVVRRGEKSVEVHCHGGPAASAAVIATLVAGGAVELAWEQWLRRSEPDPLGAEARILLSRTTTERAARILLDQCQGALRRAVDDLVATLTRGELAEADARVARLLQLAPVGLHLAEPWQVVLAGRPNVGKSSLVNALVGYQRAIVFDQPGTTRDVVTAGTALDGWPVELFDTAGLRGSRDDLEAEGIRRARQRVQRADLLLLVFDASLPWTAEDQQLVEQHPAAIPILNKCDLTATAPTSGSAVAGTGVRTSAKTGEGIETLVARIARELVPVAPEIGEAVPFLSSHAEALQRARSAIQAGSPRSARDAVGDLENPATGR